MRALPALLIALATPLAVHGQAESDSATVLNLNQVVAIAVEHSLAVRNSRLNVEIARAGVGIDRGAFDPTVILSPSIKRSTGIRFDSTGESTATSGGAELSTVLRGTLPISTQYTLALDGKQRIQDPLSTQSFRTEYDNTLTLSLTQPLLSGFGGAGGLDQARAAEDALAAAEARHRRALEVLLANVEVSYLQLAQRQEEERVAAESLQRADLLLDRNIRLLELDRITRLDLLTTQSGAASRRSALTTARKLRLNASDNLVSLIYGEAAPTQLQTLGPRLRVAQVTLDVPAPGATEDLEFEALAARQDVAAVRIDLTRQRRLLGVAENGRLPELDLTTSYTALGSNMADPYQFGLGRAGDFKSNGWNFGLSFTWALGNRRASNNAQTFRALTREAEISLTSVENSVRVEVRAASREIRFGRDAYSDALEALQLAQQLYEGEAQRLELGLTDSFRLLQVEDQVAAASQLEVASRFGLYVAVTQYKLALGSRLLEQYEVAR